MDNADQPKGRPMKTLTELLADESVIAMVRLPVGVSAMVTLGHTLEHMAARKGGRAVMRQEGEWLVVSADATQRHVDAKAEEGKEGTHENECRQ